MIRERARYRPYIEVSQDMIKMHARAWPAFRLMDDDLRVCIEFHRPNSVGKGVISTLGYYKDGDGCGGAAFGCCRVDSEAPRALEFPLGYPEPAQYVVEMLR